MPQTKIAKRRYSKPRRKCDVPPSSNFDTLEIKDDSSPESSPPFNGFFHSGQPSKSGVSQDNGRKTEDKVTHSTLSVLSDDTSRDSDLEVQPPNLLNCHCSEDVKVEIPNKCDSKGTLFSDSLLNSLTSEPLKENSMKIINDPVTQGNEDFTDLLSSISFPGHESNESSKLNFEDFDKLGVDVKFCTNKVANYADDIMKPNDFMTQSNSALSDLLSSVSFGGHSSSQTFNNLSSSSNQCFKANQIPILNKLDKTNEIKNGTLSDILSSISFDKHDSSQTSNDSSSSSLSDKNGSLSDILSSTCGGHITSQTSNNLSSSSNQCFKGNHNPILNKLDQTNESNHGTLSDILSSISFDGTNTSMQNGFMSSSNCSLDLGNFKVPVSNELNPDFETLNFHPTDTISEQNVSNLESNGNLSDMLSSIIFHENDKTACSGPNSTSFFSSNPSQDFESGALFELKELCNEHLKSDEQRKLATDKPTGLPSLTNKIQNTLSNKSNVADKTIATSSMSTPKTNKSSIEDEGNREFSFFSVSPDNVFLAMLSNLSKTPDSQGKNRAETSAEISMLDLLKSVNTDSNGSLSGYLSTPKEINTDKKDAEYSAEISMLDLLKSVNTDYNGSLSGYLSESRDIKTDKPSGLDELLDIDLSACIKTSDNSLKTLNNEQPVNEVGNDEKNNTELKLELFMKPVFDNVDLSCPKPPRMNLNQSLFAKSLSCKPKKNRILLRKVALIKSELYEHYLNHCISGDAELKMNKNITSIKDHDSNMEIVVCNTNDCMIKFKGRRLCPQEVQ